MDPTSESAHRQQNLYFQELFELKVACEYMRRYREQIAFWVTQFDMLRAIASSGAPLLPGPSFSRILWSGAVSSLWLKLPML